MERHMWIWDGKRGWMRDGEGRTWCIYLGECHSFVRVRNCGGYPSPMRCKLIIIIDLINNMMPVMAVMYVSSGSR